MNTKKTIGILVIGICIFAVFAPYMFTKLRASAKIHATSGVYVFNRASDGARYTCDLRANGVYLGGLEITNAPGSIIGNGGDIPAAITRSGNGATGLHGLPGKWEVRGGKIYVFIDGRKADEFMIQGHDLVTSDGAIYVRAK